MVGEKGLWVLCMWLNFRVCSGGDVSSLLPPLRCMQMPVNLFVLAGGQREEGCHQPSDETLSGWRCVNMGVNGRAVRGGNQNAIKLVCEMIVIVLLNRKGGF